MERSSLLLLLLLLPSPHLALLLSPLLFPQCQIVAALGDREDVVQLVGYMGGGAMGR